MAIDESNSHLILRPFFTYILRLNVQNNAKLWSLHPKLCFAGIWKKEAEKKEKTEKMAKVGNAVMLRRNYSIVATKPQCNLQKFVVTSRTMS